MHIAAAPAAAVTISSMTVTDPAVIPYYEALQNYEDETGYGLASTVNDGTILQAWNWSFANIEAMIPTIAQQGFTTVQVSPPNVLSKATADTKILQSDYENRRLLYQPAGFMINNQTDNALGTKAQFESMCETAHEYGVKIIVDTVVNHIGVKYGDESNTSTDPMSHVTPKAAQYEPEIYNNKLFHTPWAKMTYKEDPTRYRQYESTYDLTRNCVGGLPDLKTEDQRVQNAIYDYLDELIAAGADGFRFDSAKHIETPDDIQGLISDFWTDTLVKVKNKYSDREIYAYGEIMNTCGVDRPFSMYTKLFEVTDFASYKSIYDAVVSGSGSATPYYPNPDFTAADAVLFDELHDTYTDGTTTALTATQRSKIWALTAGRAGISTVYLARPSDDANTGALYDITLGEAKQTAWSDSTTKAINRFHNYFIGQSEYCIADSDGWAYIERGDSGAVIVGLGDNTTGSVRLANHNLSDGAYKDSVTGNTFTVSGNRITGTVGSSGVACIYFAGTDAQNATEAPTDPHTEPTQGSDNGDTVTLYFSNNKFWDHVNAYVFNDTSYAELSAWPGAEAVYVEDNKYGESVYSVTVETSVYDTVIFNGPGGQTA